MKKFEEYWSEVQKLCYKHSSPVPCSKNAAEIIWTIAYKAGQASVFATFTKEESEELRKQVEEYYNTESGE